MYKEKWDVAEYVQGDSYYRKKLELAIEEFRRMHPDIKVTTCDIQNMTRLHDAGMNFSVRLSLNLRDIFENETPEDYDRAR